MKVFDWIAGGDRPDRESTVSPIWLAFVAVVFCLPLYIGLGRTDISGDEAGHSFSVDRILEIGDWLAPKSSPSEDAVFLEKPPLKFWIVAAPIHLGLLPHNEFGLRFWDPLFAGLAFLYVFAIGSRLSGSLCGVTAVLMLFVHRPLVFDHGIRGNNMEAALLLCYCGGVYHFIQWARTSGEDGPRHGWLHALAVGLYFVLGFMTKFVAAAFLPLVLLTTALLFRSWRQKLLRNWGVWLGSAALALALIAPWFVYAQLRFGNELWETMLGAHVYTRFTSYLNPTHVHPWYFYFATMYDQFGWTQSDFAIIAGMVVLLLQTIRHRWPEGALVLLWFALPLCLISVGTSKLYHYAYPFLPPAALAGGYLAAFLFHRVPALFDLLERSMRAMDDYTTRSIPRIRSAFEQPAIRRVTAAVAIVSALIAAISVVYGPVRIAFGDVQLFKSSGVFRPLVVMTLAGALIGVFRTVSRVAVLLFIVGQLPTSHYYEVLARMNTGEHPMRSARDCLLGLEEEREPTVSRPAGLYVDGLGNGFGHEHYYYFRKIQPWEVAPTPSPGKLYDMYDPERWRPMLVLDSVYRDFLHGVGRPPSAGQEPASAPLVSFTDVVLLLPGPYAACSSEAAVRATPR